jgi:hypothetical protein
MDVTDPDLRVDRTLSRDRGVDRPLRAAHAAASASSAIRRGFIT